MKDYKSMSKIQINRLVTGILNNCLNWKFNDKDRCYVRVFSDKKTQIIETFYVGDFCNDPAVSWPIILSTGMSVELAHPDLGGIGTCTIYNPMGTDWQCDFDNNDDALWAAMVCFLEMKDSEA